MKRLLGTMVLALAAGAATADDFFGFPQYPGATVTEQDSYGSMHNLTLRTPDELPGVAAFYQTAPHIESCQEVSEAYLQCRFVNGEAKGVVSIERKSYGITVIDASITN